MVIKRRQKIYPIYLLVSFLLVFSNCQQDKRAKIKGNTLRSFDNKTLRGASLWAYRNGILNHEHHYTLDPKYWKLNKDYGLNCFRVICFDPWQKSRGYIHTDFENPNQRFLLLNTLDSIVHISEMLQMYLVINYHDIGRFERKYCQRFWEVIAPRYARNEFVIYELFNEPVEWFPKDYDEEFEKFQLFLYKKIRKAAPATPLILYSFPNTSNPGIGSSMLDIVKKSKGIDWDNALVGFHSYHTQHSSKDIRELKKYYPVYNTELNIPSSAHTQAMDSEKWGIETMEKLDIGWTTWKMDDYSNFKNNYINSAYLDAVQKGYYWE